MEGNKHPAEVHTNVRSVGHAILELVYSHSIFGTAGIKTGLSKVGVQGCPVDPGQCDRGRLSGIRQAPGKLRDFCDYPGQRLLGLLCLVIIRNL